MAAPKGNNYRAAGINLTPLERFMAKCRFDPGTGCVIWAGAKTSGRGHSAPYGSFWFENRRWFAHRWAAQHIHGHAIDGLQVEHYCPNRSHPNTLCVEHVHPLPSLFNRELQTLRGQAPSQDVAERMRWIYVQVGLELPPPVDLDVFEEVPFYSPPAWLLPAPVDCPF